jgi:hypothetical protein
LRANFAEKAEGSLGAQAQQLEGGDHDEPRERLAVKRCLARYTTGPHRINLLK